MKLTKEEYQKLLDMVYIGDWVTTSDTSGEERPDTQEYTNAISKFLSYAKDYELEELVEHHEDGFEVSRKFEDQSRAHNYINQYENEVFWDELVERLARRDMAAKHGKSVITRVYKDENLYNELKTIKQQYAKEFETNGLKNISL